MKNIDKKKLSIKIVHISALLMLFGIEIFDSIPGIFSWAN